MRLWMQAIENGNPLTRMSVNRGELVEAMGFTWDGEPLGSKPKPASKSAPVESPAHAPAPVEVAPDPVTAVEPVVAEPESASVEVAPDPTPDDPNPKPDATPVEELGLTAGVVSALKASGINTAGEARAAEASDTLKTLPGIGPAKLASIRAALA
jgi:hypothetical protein